MIIAVLALKGGVGKSTAAFHLAAELDRRGRRVALLDCDAQQSLATVAGRSPFPFGISSAVLDDERGARRWAETVRAVDAECIILDLPPHLEATAEAAAAIADLVLIPVRASALDFDATRRTLALIREARAVRRDRGPRALLLPSQVDRRTAAGREVAEALEGFGEAVGPPLGMRTAFAEALAEGEAVAAWAPGSPAAEEITALADAIEKEIRR